MEIPQRPEGIRPVQETERRERLSDDEMGNLLSAVGNHEGKALTLIGMTPGTIYTQRSLDQRVMEMQGQRIGWRMSKGLPFGYCQDSLAPIGLVTIEVLDSDLNTWGYMKTYYGKQTGIPLAGLLLKFSLEHPQVSLIDVFSSTQSSSKQTTTEEGLETKKRAPITRMKILWELATSQLPIRETDLATEIREINITLHLEALAKSGIILYDSPKQHESYSSYKLSPSHPQEPPLPPYKYSASLSNFVYQTLLDHPDREWTRETMSNYYGSR